MQDLEELNFWDVWKVVNVDGKQSGMDGIQDGILWDIMRIKIQI